MNYTKHYTNFVEPEVFFSDDIEAKTGKFIKVILTSFKRKIYETVFDSTFLYKKEQKN